MVKPTPKIDIPKEVRFGEFPMNVLPCSLPVRALKSAGGLEKGKVYVIVAMSTTGKVRVRPFGERETVEKLGGFPLDCFAAPIYDTDTARAVWEPKGEL